jgi:hypothetical protein
MEHAQVKRRALLWGHLLVTLPAIALIVTVLLFRNYLFVPGWPYYLTTGLALGYQWHTAAMARWRSALAKKGLSENEIEEIAEKGRLVLPGASSAGLFALHTTAAGLCATYLSFWLSGQLVHSIFPLIGQPTPSDARDFHLQHFEVMNIVPALLLGYLIARQFPKLSSWAWLLPTLVISYKLITFADPNTSVLTGSNTWDRFSYFFVIQRLSPIHGSDPERWFQQVTVVGSFYSSLAYSVGAVAMKTKALQRVWESFSREPNVEIIEPEEAGIVDIPNESVEPLQRK